MAAPDRLPDYVAALLFQLQAVNPRQHGLAHRELRFHPSRRWRADLAWPREKLILEVDGGSWIGGRHTSGAGFERDCEKLSEAAALGYRVIRCTPRQVESGECLGWVERALNG